MLGKRTIWFYVVLRFGLQAEPGSDEIEHTYARIEIIIYKAQRATSSSVTLEVEALSNMMVRDEMGLESMSSKRF